MGVRRYLDRERVPTLPAATFQIQKLTQDVSLEGDDRTYVPGSQTRSCSSWEVCLATRASSGLARPRILQPSPVPGPVMSVKLKIFSRRHLSLSSNLIHSTPTDNTGHL